MKLYFNIEYKTKPGEQLELVVTENENSPRVHPMFYTADGLWICEIDFFSKSISYRYQLSDSKKNILRSELATHHLTFPHNYKEFLIFDQWNSKNFPENYLRNKILEQRISKENLSKLSVLKKHTHLFRIEAPLYNPDWQIVISGNVDTLGNWRPENAIPLQQTDFGVWETSVNIQNSDEIHYKYAIFDRKAGLVTDFETGAHRVAMPNANREVLQIQADHYFKFKAYQMYHDAGVAVPVFSLRTEDSFGVGEFQDLKKLADWAHKTSLGMIQVLPINDTTAHHSWMDSYPYSAISVYALHPQYISLEKLSYGISDDIKSEYEKEKTALNDNQFIDYEKIMSGKWKYLRQIFSKSKNKIYKDRHFKKFIKDQESWLLPYSAFCVLRDKYKTPDFSKWKTHKKYISGKVSPFFNAENKDYDAAMLHAWVQFELHTQLCDAVNYIHSLGISLKGDLPIGIYRFSVEAWTEPELFGMDFQAGAPPDQFTELGQNWGFPTYNWDAMKKDGYQWWKNRFKALEQYFDALRIDHILGFFRIWRMPVSATQGILGYFYPAIPVVEQEFKARHIPFDFDRYCKPFINDEILHTFFNGEADRAKDFLIQNENGTYTFKEEFDSQRKITDHFEGRDFGNFEEKMIELCANVLFLTENKAGETVYHPRFNFFKTESYRYLSDWEKQALYDLYQDYFYSRQDFLWKESAMEKLPPILSATDMLICGEDLGLVPKCVPEVMDDLAIIALKVQRMPSENIPFYDPKNAGYLNVVTASSHDSSTLRQWWKEDRELTQKYFNQQLLQTGKAPDELEPWIAEMIMKQHLYNNAMLAIFPIQEFFATDKNLTNPDMDSERINDPSKFPHFWKYRMHLKVEDLLENASLNDKIANWIEDSGRA